MSVTFVNSCGIRKCLHETRNEISTNHKRISVYLTFHSKRNEISIFSEKNEKIQVQNFK